jgi:hypothetical protein
MDDSTLRSENPQRQGELDPRTLSIAVIGDMVGSRTLPTEQRRSTQVAFARLMDDLNEEFSGNFSAKFAITQGDEFEGLLRMETADRVLPNLIWHIEERFPAPALRLGIGLGGIDTSIPFPPQSAITLDGPAFHRAREAVVQAAKKQQMGGVFLGFGDIHDAILNGLARVLHRQRQRWSDKQREVAMLLHNGMRQMEVARRTERKRQAVSIDAKAAGWNAYVEGERALHLAIREALITKLDDINR